LHAPLERQFFQHLINEALEIAKLYGAEGAFKLVNASLDKLAQSLRKVEMDASK
jgi:N utilization substance protein B